MAERGLTRRTLLASSLGMVMSGLAGCGQAPAETPSSPFVETTFDGPELVVRLRDGHEVSRLNLIDSDGELFVTTDVAAGATTARLEILRIEPGSRMKHYTPGVHTLVAVGEDEERSVELEMEPSLRVVEVQQYRAGTEASDLGRLAVTVENVGTGPTWVYTISYIDPPNWTAGFDVDFDPGAPQLHVPTDPRESIINPGTIREFVGPTSPILLSTDSTPECNGSSEFTLVIGQAIGNPLETGVAVSYDGQFTWVGITDDYVCSDVSAEILSGVSDD